MFQNFYTRFKQSPLAIISFFIGVANWQLLLGLRSTQWDMINFWLPWRHYIAQCYTNGIVPLWNPYSQAGYPIHGDLQGPAYSLEAIITSFISPINIYFLNYLYIFYLILGAYGFYKLVLFFIDTLSNKYLIERSTKSTSLVAAVAGVSFALCGYNSWHGHYLYVMISVCLLPWIYYFFFKILNKGAWQDALKLALVIWWQITAGNPSFIIVSFYFLLFAFICRVVYNFRRKLNAANKKLLLHMILTGACSLVLCAPVFLNAFYVFDETSRAGGISLEWAAEENLIWENIFAFFSSLAGYEREMHSGENQPVYNLYLGIPTLLFAWYGIRKFRSFWINVFSVIAILSLLLSLGLDTPLYRLFHSHLPFFNVFRMPNLIIIYTLIYLVVMSSLGMLYLLKNNISPRKYIVFSVITLIISCISVLFFKYIYTETQNNHVTDYTDLRSFLWSASQSRKVFISLVFTCLILVVGYILVRKKKFEALLLVLLIDICINYSAGAIARVVGDTSAAYTNSFLSGLPEGFGAPDNIPANKVNGLTFRMNALWLNAPTFIQQPAYNNDNNFELSNYMKLYNDNKEEFNYFTQRPLAFLADSLVKHSDFKPDTLQRKVIATLSDSTYAKFKDHPLQSSAGDVVMCKKFLPQHFVYEVKNKEAIAFVLQQNLTRLWKIRVNGREIQPELSYYSFPFVFLNAGEHEIEFIYQVPYFKLLFFVSVTAGCLIILIILLFSKKRRVIAAAAFLVLCGFCCLSFFNGRGNLQESTLETELKSHESLINKYQGTTQIINTKDAFSSTPLQKNGARSLFNLLFNEDLAAFLQKIKDCKDDYLLYISYKSLHSEETETLIRLNYGEPFAEEKIHYGFIRVYKRNPQAALGIWTKENNFNSQQDAWTVTDSLSGNTKIKRMKGNEYGGSIDFILKDIGAKPHDLVYAECDLETKATDMPGMCLSIDRNGVNRAFISYGNLHPGPAGKTALVYRIPESVKETDKITVFFWNNSNQPALIDNMKVQVIKMD
ncbi:MAG: putative rane protein [Bacteroidetes bacterium]|nr:putative rane protein [Bacteroidota bacterium]